MSDPLAASLSKFTPDASGLDRDALLFAAGQASVRPARRWMVLAGALAASQLLTLAMLWNRGAGPGANTVPGPPTIAIHQQNPTEDVSRPAARDASSLWTLRDRVLDSDGELSSPRAVGPMSPSEPPMRAFAEPPETLLN